ncbi:MAG: hypothetical protein AABX23_03305 [Nanoarchaeota archaeon]
MINRGDTRTIWVGVIIGIAVLVITLTGVWKNFLVFVGLAKLLPSFNITAPEGTSIVGVNLKTNELELGYYIEGDRWQVIADSSKAYTLDKYEFVPNEIKKELLDFYVNTKRKPENFNIDINSWRYWVVSQEMSVNSLVKVYPKTKKTFEEKEKVNSLPLYFKFGYTNDATIDFEDYNIAQDAFVPEFVKPEYESLKNSDHVQNILAWRDSILQGNKCEKFLTFANLKEDKAKSDKEFSVRLVDGYLLVDLKLDNVGKTQDYKDNCFGLVSYEDKDEISSEMYTQVGTKPDIRFSFDFDTDFDTPAPGYVSYSSSGWNVDPRFDDARLITSENSFYENLILLTKPNGLFWNEEVYFEKDKNDGNDGVFIKGRAIDVDYLREKEWHRLNHAQTSQFVFNILNGYYADYKIVKGGANA